MSNNKSRVLSLSSCSKYDGLYFFDFSKPLILYKNNLIYMNSLDNFQGNGFQQLKSSYPKLDAKTHQDTVFLLGKDGNHLNCIAWSIGASTWVNPSFSIYNNKEVGFKSQQLVLKEYIYYFIYYLPKEQNITTGKNSIADELLSLSEAGKTWNILENCQKKPLPDFFSIKGEQKDINIQLSELKNKVDINTDLASNIFNWTKNLFQQNYKLTHIKNMLDNCNIKNFNMKDSICDYFSESIVKFFTSEKTKEFIINDKFPNESSKYFCKLVIDALASQNNKIIIPQLLSQNKLFSYEKLAEFCAKNGCNINEKILLAQSGSLLKDSQAPYELFAVNKFIKFSINEKLTNLKDVDKEVALNAFAKLTIDMFGFKFTEDCTPITSSQQQGAKNANVAFYFEKCTEQYLQGKIINGEDPDCNASGLSFTHGAKYIEKFSQNSGIYDLGSWTSKFGSCPLLTHEFEDLSTDNGAQSSYGDVYCLIS